MAKLKNPFSSLSASGRFTNVLTFVRRHHSNIAESTPQPKDAKSFYQLSWRHMYQKAVALWHALSDAEKQSWESLARPFHMTGFAYFISQALKPNPGLYLPLQGGTMAGDIDMDGFKIEDLPNPTLAGHPLIKDARFGVEQFEWPLNKLLLGAGLGVSPTTIDVPSPGVSPTIVLKTSNEIVNNSTTLQNDDELLLAIGANEKWLVKVHINVSGSQDSDFKWTFIAPTGATGYWCVPQGGQLVRAFAEVVDTTIAGTFEQYVIHFPFVITILNGSNAGNLQLQWCQNTAVVENTTVKKDSSLIAWEI